MNGQPASPEIAPVLPDFQNAPSPRSSRWRLRAGAMLVRIGMLNTGMSVICNHVARRHGPNPQELHNTDWSARLDQTTGRITAGLALTLGLDPDTAQPQDVATAMEDRLANADRFTSSGINQDTENRHWSNLDRK